MRTEGRRLLRTQKGTTEVGRLHVAVVGEPDKPKDKLARSTKNKQRPADIGKRLGKCHRQL